MCKVLEIYKDESDSLSFPRAYYLEEAYYHIQTKTFVYEYVYW